MEDITTAREKILKKVRSGLLNKFARQIPDVDQESSVFKYTDQDHLLHFAKKYTGLGSGFVYCHNFFDFIENQISFIEKRQIKQLLCSDRELLEELSITGLPVEEYQAHPNPAYGLVRAEALVARNGGVLLSSGSTDRLLLSSARTLLIYAKVSLLAEDMKQSLVFLKNRYGEKLPGLFTFYQGPSRIIDERGKVLRRPEAAQEMILFLVNDR
jgi:L-lactate dehydrogenase complex protein LldG